MSKFPLPHSLYTGDGLSGFALIRILPRFDGENVWFHPVDSGGVVFFHPFDYKLPLSVFQRIYLPCGQQDESYSSKTALRLHQPFYTPVLKFFKAVLRRIARRS